MLEHILIEIYIPRYLIVDYTNKMNSVRPTTVYIIVALILFGLLIIGALVGGSWLGGVAPALPSTAPLPTPTPRTISKNSANPSTCTTQDPVHTTLKGALQNPNTVCHLILSHPISYLPPNIDQWSQILTLTIPQGDLITLPSTIDKLSTVQAIIITNNKLQTLPDEIGQLPYLQWLILDNNQLRSLPTSIAQLPQLEVLSLRGNPLPEEEKNRLRTRLPGATLYF